MKFLTNKQLNIIRGKVIAGAATTKEILSVFGHLDQLEVKLDDMDQDDFFGTEGWRYLLGLED